MTVFQNEVKSASPVLMGSRNKKVVQAQRGGLIPALARQWQVDLCLSKFHERNPSSEKDLKDGSNKTPNSPINKTFVSFEAFIWKDEFTKWFISPRSSNSYT